MIFRCVLSSFFIIVGLAIFIPYACVASVEYVGGICGFGLIILGIISTVFYVCKYKWMKIRGRNQFYHYDELMRPRDATEQFLPKKNRRVNDYYYDDEEELAQVGLTRRDEKRESAIYSSYKESMKCSKYCATNIACKVFLFILLSPVFIFTVAYLFQSIGYSVDVVSPIGKLVTISLHGKSYRLHMDCRGEQTGQYPTVVIDSGLGISSSSVYWSDIQNNVANTTRVCVYDRAGYGFSDSGTFPRTSKQIAEELAVLLTESNITEPIILVGHSFGGMNTRLFTSLYREKVTGLLLIDPSHENQTMVLRQAEGKSTDPSAISSDHFKEVSYLNFARIASPLGLLRLTSLFYGDSIINPFSKPDLTNLQKKTLSFTGLSNKQSNVVYSEGSNFATLSAQEVANNRTSFGDLPLVILSAGASLNGTCAENHIADNSDACKEWMKYLTPRAAAFEELVRDVLTLSSKSSWKVIWGSSHNIAIDNPPAVIEAILSLLKEVKK